MGMTQHDLAGAVGYKSGTAISLIESGAREVKSSSIALFANALGVSTSVLIGEDTASDISTAIFSDNSLSPSQKKELSNFYEYVKNTGPRS